MKQAESNRQGPWVILSALLLLGLGLLALWQLYGNATLTGEPQARAATTDKAAAPVTTEESSMPADRSTQQMHYPSYSELYLWGQERSGLQLELTGRFHALDGTEEWLPAGFVAGDSAAVVYKYAVGCCPKHAAPAVVLLPGIEKLGGYDSMASGDWVRITGRFGLSAGELPLPLIEASMLEATVAPEDELEQIYPTSEMPRSCTGSFPELNYPPGRPLSNPPA